MKTKYLNPKYDFVFKKIFGSPNSVAILKSLLNAFISHAGLNEIIDLEILNPYQAAKHDKMKDTYVDVKAKDKTGRIFIIEMQMLSVSGFEKRI
jgi:predicted transposase/invertase (TIGR01784 family)